MDELEAFPREAIALRPVGEREHDLLVDGLLPLRPPSGDYDHPLYYYRPWKTILCRTVAVGGTSHYIRGDRRQTIPALWNILVNKERSR